MHIRIEIHQAILFLHFYPHLIDIKVININSIGQQIKANAKVKLLKKKSTLPIWQSKQICDDFQTLNSISAEKNSTIIFPLPMEILGGFMEEGVRKRKNNVEQ